MTSFSFSSNGLACNPPEVDGHKLMTVESFTVECNAGELPRVTLRLIGDEALQFALTGGYAWLDDDTAAALVMLGWTPPPAKPELSPAEELAANVEKVAARLKVKE